MDILWPAYTLILILIIGHPGLANGASTPASPPGKIGQTLSEAYRQYQTQQNHTLTESNGAAELQAQLPLLQIKDGYIRIDVIAAADPAPLRAELELLGAKEITQHERIVSCSFPVEKLPALNDLASVRFVRPIRVLPDSGSVTTQGDAALHANTARAVHSVDGTGVTVGVLSNSYNCRNGASTGVSNGDLPEGVTVLKEGGCSRTDDDEGRAIMEIIHDIAPGAKLMFHTALVSEGDFAEGIQALFQAGARVLVDDVRYLEEPMLLDGKLARAVDSAVSEGAIYIATAGNYARRSYEDTFRPSGQLYNDCEAHDFDAGPGIDIHQNITIPRGARILLPFQWSELFFSVNGPPGSGSDLNIYLLDTNLQRVGIGGADNNTGNDPSEVLSYTNNAATGEQFHLVITRCNGPLPRMMKYVQRGDSSVRFLEYHNAKGTSYGHSSATGSITVGAADYRQTPAFGTTPPRVEKFSSGGGLSIYRDNSGKELETPEIRLKPDFIAVDNINTSFFNAGADVEADGFPNFLGTSAAAPHAAGIVALLLQQRPGLSVDHVRAILTRSAIDMDDPQTPTFDIGFDTRTGYGLIQADTALAVKLLCNGVPATIVGTSGDDIITGTDGNDVIIGLGGNDTIHGMGGDDRICGKAGKDKIFGDGGNDQIWGGPGKDELDGGEGENDINGGPGNDVCVNFTNSTNCEG